MRTVALAAVALLLAAPTAAATPTLIAPTTASLADSRPLVAWTPGVGETIEAVYIATTSGTTPEGQLYDETRVDTGFPAASVTSYQPTSRLPAGTYYWNVRWMLGEPTYDNAYSPVASFTIPLQLRRVGVSIEQWGLSGDTVTVRYLTNAATARITCSVYHGRRRIARRSTRDTYITPLGREESTCQVNVPRSMGGKRLRLVGEVVAGGCTARASRYFIGMRG
jgi:hypothetical protein